MPSLLLLHCKPADKLKMFYVTSNYMKYQKVKLESQFFWKKNLSKKKNKIGSDSAFFLQTLEHEIFYFTKKAT